MDNSPEKKAKELISKFFKHTSDSSSTIDPTYHAKQCALICVDEIIEVVESDESAIIVQLQYWQSVKDHLNKL